MTEVTMVEVTPDNEALIRAANGSLDVHEHHKDCPVYHAASVDCVWPIAVCVPEDYKKRFGGSGDDFDRTWADVVKRGE